MKLGRVTIAPGFLVAVAVGASDPALAQSAPAVNPIDLFSLRTISEVRISPDGRNVAFTVTGLPPDRSLDQLRSQIRMASVQGRGDRAVSSPASSAKSPQWSPDGRLLGYLGSQSGTDDVWVVPAGGGPARRVTRATTSVQSFAWAPDGRRIAFVMSDPADPAIAKRQRLVRLASDTAPAARLWIVSIDAPAGARAVTQPPLNVLATPAWSPDGGSIAFVHGPTSAMLAVYAASASVIDLGTRTLTPLRFVGSDLATPQFSPDGRWVALRASTKPSPGPVSGALFAVSADGKEERSLGPADGYTEINGWTEDGAGVIVTSQVGTMRRVHRRLLGGGAATELYRGPLVVSGLHLSQDRTHAAFVGESLDTPAEVHVSSLGDFAPKSLTSINAGRSLPPFGRTELLTWKSPDGATIEGLLTHPAGSTAATPVPLLVVAHAGGETFASGYVANPLAGSSMAYPPPVFSSRGYAVLRVNQRGGGLGGYGFESSLPIFKPVERANHDILAGVDLVVGMGVGDARRVAIMGWSNGGLVTQSLITSTDRFAAASVLAGFPELAVQAGVNPWIYTDVGAEPWERPERYVALSPTFALNRTRAATLVVHGADDAGVPVSQAMSFHGSLVKLGVPTELAIYPGMGHAPSTPRQMIDIAERNLAWFDRYLRRR